MDDPSDFVKGTRLKSFFERVQESQANSPASSRNTSTNCSPSVSLGSYNNNNNNNNNNHNNSVLLSSPSASSAKSTPTSSGNFSRSIFGTSAFQMHIQETSPILKQQQKEQKEQKEQQNQNQKQSQMKILSSPPSTKNHQKSQQKSGNKNSNKNDSSSSLAVPVVPLSAASLEEENSNNNNQNLEVLQTIPAHLSTAPGSPPPSSSAATTSRSSKSNSSHHKKNHKSHNNNNNYKDKKSSAAADDGGEQPTNKNENDPSSVNEQQQQNFFTRGPIPISVISKHFEQRKIKYIKQLGDRLHLGQRHNNNDMYCSYFLTLQEAAFVHQLFNQYRTDSRHPGSVVVVCAIKHSDGIVEVETEYCDVGPVERLYQYLDKPNYRYHAPIVAKSVARQVLLALQTFNVVHSKVHRAVSSRTVLVRRDGCVKLGIFDAIIRDDFNTSNSYANKFLTSPFCAPECRPSSISNNQQQQVIGKNFSAASSAPVFGSGNQNNNSNNSSDFISRMNATALQTTDKKLIVDHFMKHSESHKADVWSVGVLILSILLKDSFFGDGSTPKTTETLNELIFGRNNDALWCQIIPDTGLRFLTRRCLEIDPKKRISLNDAVALTFIFGRTQGFRRKSFAAVPDDKIWKQKQLTMSMSEASSNNDHDHGDDDNKTKNNTTTIPPWARYTECPFATPDFIPSDDDDDEYDEDVTTVAAEEMKKSISGENKNNNNTDQSDKKNDNDDNVAENSADDVASSTPTTTPASTARRNHQKKQEEVPMKDIIATRHLCKLLDESTMEPETKLLSCLPCCCIAASSSESSNNNNDSNTNNCTTDASSTPINQQKIEEIIQKHTRRVSVLLDLELRSHLTKRLNNPSGILHIEKQMKEVMKMRVQPAMRCLRAIVSDISTIRRQQQQQQKK